MGNVMEDALRAVIDAARTWRAETVTSGEEAAPETTVTLWKAIDALEDALDGGAPNAPTGFAGPKAWGEIPAGWFVLTPSHAWFEVISTEAAGTTQHISLRSPQGSVGSFTYPASAKVTAKQGTHVKELSAAVKALSDSFGSTRVLDDPPWNES
jgi:hypothetical protein